MTTAASSRLRWLGKHALVVKLHRGPDAPEPLPCREVARRLGPPWTTRRVQHLACGLGLAVPRPPAGQPGGPWTPRLDAALRRLCARGLTDRAVGHVLRRSRRAVRRRRRMLGVCPCPPHRHALSGPLSPRAVGARKAAGRGRWPQARTPAESRLLDVLERLGAVAPPPPALLAALLPRDRERVRCGRWLTGRRLARALGLRWVHNGPRGLASRLRRLARRGALDVRVVSRGPGQGKGGRRLLVRIAAGVADRLGRLAGMPRDDE